MFMEEIMIGYYNYTVILTYLGLASGIMGMVSAIENRPVLALGFLMLAGFFDMFDGMVARTKKRTTSEKKFGIELDSLSDIVCFGVLPAIIGYTIGLRKWYYVIVLILYVLAALIRLAYFNVVEDERQANTTEVRKSYEGLPVTTVALIIPLLYPLISYFKSYMALAYALILLIIGFLFLSKIKVVKFKIRGMIVLIVVGILELLLLIFTRVL